MSPIPTTVQREAATNRCTELDALGLNIFNFLVIINKTIPKQEKPIPPTGRMGFNTLISI